MKKYILVILDGAADKKSAFAAANKPNIAMLAASSECGLWSGPHGQGYNPRSMSGIATLEILGYSAVDEPGRGYFEVLGLGLKPKKNSIYLRGNFATVKNGKMVDRRAGRDETGLDTLVTELNKIKPIAGVKVKVYRLPGHRVAVELSGKGLDKHVTDNDIGENPAEVKPLNKKSEKTAAVLNIFIKKASDLLSTHPVNRKRKVPANFIAVRSAGSYQHVESFKKRFNLRACMISGHVTLLGVARYVGMDIIATPLSQLENDLDYRAKKAIQALNKYDMVVLHINGTDTCSHDKNYEEKVRYLEKIDSEVFSQLLKLRHVNLAIISDHITNSKTGEHLFGPVPFLVYNSEGPRGNNHKFDEKNCKKGFVAHNPMRKILEV